MRGAIFLLPAILAGCAGGATNAPSLAPRAAEAIDPRVPVPDPVLPTTPSAELVAKLDALVAQAIAGDEAFRTAAANAEPLVAAAGGRETESWIVAQQALTDTQSARAPVSSALGDIDAMGSERIQRLGGIAAADLKAIDAAAARVSEIDEREAATIARLQAQLSR
jgi:hypothetical protein